jgi:hypothetical protein
MNLDSLNLVELNAQEIQEVDGGRWLAWFIDWGLPGVDFMGDGMQYLT